MPWFGLLFFNPFQLYSCYLISYDLCQLIKSFFPFLDKPITTVANFLECPYVRLEAPFYRPPSR